MGCISNFRFAPISATGGEYQTLKLLLPFRGWELTQIEDAKI
jgi:hypothetical protein